MQSFSIIKQVVIKEPLGFRPEGLKTLDIYIMSYILGYVQRLFLHYKRFLRESSRLILVLCKGGLYMVSEATKFKFSCQLSV
jgi:hypothetical protein